MLLRDYFNSFNLYTQTTNYPGTKLVGVPFKLRKRMKNSLPWVHVLHKTLNLVISRCCFAEDDKEIQNARAERLFLLIKPFVLWLCRRRRRGVFVRSLAYSTGTRAYFRVSQSATCELGSTQVRRLLPHWN